MKKIIALVLSLILLLSLGVGVSAAETQAKIGDLSVVIPEGFVESSNDGQSIIYENDEAKRSVGYIYVEGMLAGQGISTVRDFNEADLKAFLNTVSSEDILTEGLKSYDETAGNVKITATDSKYIEINGIPVYEYTLWYTSSIQNGSVVIGVFVNDDDMYMYLYERVQRDTEGEKLLRESVEKMSFTKEAPAEQPIKILIDGEYITPDSDPVIKNDRTIVPIRAVAEKLGYDVSWEAETRTAVITNGETILRVTIDAPEMVKETKEEVDFVPEFYTQEKISLDVAATIINDRTYLPLRAVGEALGCDVDWDAANRTVIINSK